MEIKMETEKTPRELEIEEALRQGEERDRVLQEQLRQATEALGSHNNQDPQEKKKFFSRFSRKPKGPDSAPSNPATLPETQERIPTPEEIENARLRTEYFESKKNNTGPGGGLGLGFDEVKTKYEAYQASKKKIVESCLARGEAGKAEAQEFLLREVEFKRANDLKNMSFVSPERMRAGISRSIEQWDKWGVEQKDSNGNIIKKGSITAKMAKMGISIVMIAGVSSFSVQKAAELGIGTASALGSGVGARLVQKLSVGLGLGSIMEGVEKLPYSADTKVKIKRGLQRAILGGTAGMVALSPLGTAGLLAMGASSGLGYLASRFTRKYEGKIDNRMKEVKNTSPLNMDTIDADITSIEEKIQEALKKAEKTRFVGKILEVATALTVSAGTLEAMGVAHNVHENTLKHNSELAKAKIAGIVDKSRPAPYDKSPYDQQLHFNPDGTPNLSNTETHLSPIDHSTDGAQTGAPADTGTAEHAPINPDAVIHKGEGIEHAFRRQIEHDANLAKVLGFKGDPNDAKALHAFSGGAAHKLAIDEGYVSKDGQEIRVIGADRVAYQAHIGDDGHVVIEERSIDGTQTFETHTQGDKFEQGKEHLQNYEKVYSGHHAGPAHGASAEGTAKSEVETEWKPDAPTNPLAGIKTDLPGAYHAIDNSHSTPDSIHHDADAKIDELTAKIKAMQDSFNSQGHTTGGVETSHITQVADSNAGGYVNAYHAPTMSPGGVLPDLSGMPAGYGGQYGAGMMNNLSHGITNHGVPHTVQISVEDVGVLKAHPEFSHDVLHLGLNQHQMAEVYNTHDANLHKIFPDHTSDAWKEMQKHSAYEVMNGKGTDEHSNQFIAHMQKIQEYTQIKPDEGGVFRKPETLEHYMIKAYQKAESIPLSGGGTMLDKLKQ